MKDRTVLRRLVIVSFAGSFAALGGFMAGYLTGRGDGWSDAIDQQLRDEVSAVAPTDPEAVPTPPTPDDPAA